MADNPTTGGCENGHMKGEHTQHEYVSEYYYYYYSVALVRKQTIPTERPLLVGKVSANLCG
jgi:hypothetical protein